MKRERTVRPDSFRRRFRLLLLMTSLLAGEWAGEAAGRSMAGWQSRLAVVSAASYAAGVVAAEQIVAGFGTGLARGVVGANGEELPVPTPTHLSYLDTATAGKTEIYQQEVSVLLSMSYYTACPGVAGNLVRSKREYQR